VKQPERLPLPKHEDTKKGEQKDMATLEETIQDNASENDHLRKLMKRLSDEALRTPMAAGSASSSRVVDA
jgi:hypothetical protein